MQSNDRTINRQFTETDQNVVVVVKFEAVRNLPRATNNTIKISGIITNLWTENSTEALRKTAKA